MISAATISPERVGALLSRIRDQRPLVHHVTNPVTAGDVADVAAAVAVEPDQFAAAVMGLLCFEVAAEVAAESAGGPGTFRAGLIDAVAALDGAFVARHARVAPA